MTVLSFHPTMPLPFHPQRKPALTPTIRADIRRIARGCGARNVRVFGSFARGQQHQRSDLDLLVELPADSSLLDLARLKVELEARLRRKVDVIPEGSLKRALRDRIFAEARPV
jgi:predicted nucleotidyltransferase